MSTGVFICSLLAIVVAASVLAMIRDRMTDERFGVRWRGWDDFWARNRRRGG